MLPDLVMAPIVAICSCHGVHNLTLWSHITLAVDLDLLFHVTVTQPRIRTFAQEAQISEIIYIVT